MTVHNQLSSVGYVTLTCVNPGAHRRSTAYRCPRPSDLPVQRALESPERCSREGRGHGTSGCGKDERIIPDQCKKTIRSLNFELEVTRSVRILQLKPMYYARTRNTTSILQQTKQPTRVLQIQIPHDAQTAVRTFTRS